MDLIHQALWYLKPEGITFIIQTFGMVGICAIIFAETGFFALLPGDSLLVLCGIFAATLDPATGQPLLPLWALLTVVPVCGMLGDQVGYSLGRWLGQKIYGWPEVKLAGIPVYKRSFLDQTEAFYKKYGVFAIVAGRWVPIVRTFAPIVAGMTRMPYRTFIPFNIIGALTWVWSMVLAGYFLPPLLRSVAPGFDLARNIDKIALGIVVASVLPILYTIWKERRARSVTVGAVITPRATPRKKSAVAKKKRR